MKSFSYTLIFAFAFCFICQESAAQLIKDDGKQFPPYFGETNDTLLIVKPSRKMDAKTIGRYFTKDYSGPFLLIDSSQLHLAPYNDITKFRYYVEDKTTTQIGPSNGFYLSTSFSMTDRKLGKTFRTKVRANYGKFLDEYINALESLIKKNHK